MSNTTTNVLPKLLAQGLMALRENSVMTRLVNRDYDNLAAQKGAAINIPIPSAVTATNVTPSNVLASNQDMSPTVAVVTLDFWKEATFQLSDKDIAEVMDGVIPMQASAAIRALSNAVDQFILGKHTGFFGAVGTAGSTPFNGSVTDAASARKLLNKQLAPLTDRRAVLDPDAENALTTVPDILRFDGAAEGKTIISGTIGTKLGIDWYMDQNISTYTPGTAWITGWSADGSAAIGASTLNVTFTNSGTVKVGDIFQLTAGGLGYVVTAGATAVTATTMAIVFYPPLRTAVATAAALVIGAGSTAYVANLAFHRDA
ncbi:MAG TPA: hypothetical protein VN903_39155, partial [Polyangia bacterium]|nr:hypothetical protein [Polyangia bacterium]